MVVTLDIAPILSNSIGVPGIPKREVAFGFQVGVSGDLLMTDVAYGPPAIAGQPYSNSTFAKLTFSKIEGYTRFAVMHTHPWPRAEGGSPYPSSFDPPKRGDLQIARGQSWYGIVVDADKEGPFFFGGPGW